MLVRSIETNALTGKTTEKWVDMPDVVTPEAQAVVDAANAQTAQVAATNETTIGQQVDAALAANATYLSIASPTTAQAVAQVRKLTQQMDGVIRLLRRKLDATT